MTWNYSAKLWFMKQSGGRMVHFEITCDHDNLKIYIDCDHINLRRMSTIYGINVVSKHELLSKYNQI